MGRALTLISAPAALMIAGILVPPGDTGKSNQPVDMPRQYGGSMEAVARGTLDAIPLFLNIIAMLVVLVALVHLVAQHQPVGVMVDGLRQLAPLVVDYVARRRVGR